MNKRGIKKTTIGIIIATGVFLASSMVALANNSGYESYKKALFSTLNAKSITADVKMKIEANDQSITETSMLYKTDGKDHYSESTYSDYNDLENPNIYIDRSDEYSRDYTSGRFLGSLTDKQQRLGEVLIDAFLGDMKNYIMTDGNKITATLDEQQVPELYQALLSVMIEGAQSDINSTEYYNEDGKAQLILEIVNSGDISIKSVKGEGEIDENGFIKNFKLIVEVGGHNSDKEYKSLKLQFDAELSNINSTVIPAK